MKNFTGKKLRLTERLQGIAILTFDAEPGVLNKFDTATLSELHTALSILENHRLNGLIINSAQAIFFAGGDITEFSQRFQQSTAKIQTEINSYQQALNRLEALPYPSLCAINGAALGGGVEIALACDYRLAVHDARLGSPEVTLGLIPGTGATVRLPRIIGVERALQWIADGTIIRADQCDNGLLDEICSSQDELNSRAWSKLQEAIAAPEDWQQRRQKKRQAIANPPPAAIYRQAEARLDQHYHDSLSFRARTAAVHSIADSVYSDQNIALAIESMYLIELGQTRDSHLLIEAFINKTQPDASAVTLSANTLTRQHFSK